MRSEGRKPPARFRTGSQLAGYRLEDQIGAGGMAVVFRARDERLGRLVALKILLPTPGVSTAGRQRFIREARAAAAVDDPHIIPVYDAGEADGVLFLAMRFAQGGDLRLALTREGRLPPDRAAGFFSPVALALDAAHRAGLVHRDVKPGNILVDTRPGRPDHVYLSDFGISKGFGASTDPVVAENLTGSGIFLGTADYAAPEQIRDLAVDGRADQYGLACVTYEMLTGVVPFERPGAMGKLLAHVQEPPPSLTARRPDLPAAAAEVLARALAKNPAERYATCGDFVDALRDALGLPPHLVRHVATARIASARPAAGSAPAETTATVAAGPVPAAASATASATPRAPGGGWRHRAGTIAAAAVIVGLAVSVPFLAKTPAGAVRPEIPVAASSHAPAPRPARPLAGRIALPAGFAGQAISSVALSPSGKTLAIAGGPGICLWNVAARSCSAVLPGAWAVAFSPDGKTLAGGDDRGDFAAGPNGVIRLWDVASRRQAAPPLVSLPRGTGALSVAFSPDGKTLAIGDQDGTAYLWNMATGKSTALRDPRSKGVYAVAFSPDGTLLAVADANGTTYMRNVATRKSTALRDPDSWGVDAVAFSPDGTLLATADGNGTTYVWDVATMRRVTQFRDPDTDHGVWAVAFSPDGKTLATGDYNGVAYLWAVSSGKLMTSLPDMHDKGVTTMAFGRTGTTLVTGNQDGSVDFWPIRK